ncbi:family 78 glycoside hydrolase catalytic domain [candidate division KSB1 bacterium]|nr:family 78 glycoside hydrolase catalytic domain [candidate division KSB1 bacterium]
MKLFPVLFGLLVFSAILPSLALEITTLTCNGAVNPLGMDEAPAFSWILSADERGAAQTAYQLQIATSLALLQRDEADLYDSDKKLTSQSIAIKPENFTVTSRVRYFWRIRVWDQRDEVSAWSEPAWFEMGLLNDSDWRAHWISAPVLFDWQAIDGRRKKIPKDAPPELPEPAPLLRKEFTLTKKISSARARICGLGYHELYLNGHKVGDHLLDPAFTRYDKRALYVTHDITSFLQQGENAVGVMLGNGWYNMTSRDVWGFDHASWRAQPTVICQIEINFADGTEEFIISDKSWRCAPGPIVFNSIRQGEWYDARLERVGWDLPRYDDAAWHAVREVRGPEGRLCAQDMPPVKIHSSFAPRNIERIAQGHFLIDFGQNMAGFVELTASGAAGQEITMIYAEKVRDGRVDQSNIDGLVASAPFQTDKYILKGEGVERWRPRFTYHGFQYVEIQGYPGELRPENLTAFAISTAFAQHGDFSCSNELINQIQHNARWSYRNNFVGYPTDCPQREKNGWTGDAQLAAEAGLFNFASHAAYKKWIRDIADEQRLSGEVAAIIPTAGWGYYWGNGPAWDSAFILIPYYLYLYTGDLSVIAAHYEQMKRYVDFLGEKSDGGIVSWGLGDWCHEKTDTPAAITSTGYYYVDAALLSSFAQLLGRADDAERYAALASDIRAAFMGKYVDLEKGAVGNNSQTALSCALYQGFLQAGDAEKIAKNLLNAIRMNGDKLDFGILGAKYALNALSQAGYADVAYQLINHREYPGWGHWISRGATTLWEDWQGASSLNHIMFGDVSAWFFKNIAGIQPDPTRPGFKHFYLRPFFPDDMQWAAAQIESPYGPLRSEWRRSADGVQLVLHVPVNCQATLELAGRRHKDVRLDGPDGIDFQGDQDGKLVYRLSSGSYRLHVRD